MVVKGGNPHPLIENIVRLLKPGGWIQWDEADCASFCAHAPSREISCTKATALIDRWQTFAAKSDLRFEWLSDLPGLLQIHGFKVVDEFRKPISDDLRKPSTDSFVMALEEIGRRASERDPGMLGTAEEWEHLFHGLVEDVGCCVTISMDMVVALGRKK